MQRVQEQKRQGSTCGFVVDWQLPDFAALISPNVGAGQRDQAALRVLLVEADAAARERIGKWLSQDGYDVIECPGPSAPDYTCLGSRGMDCPLAKAAAVVVLDLSLSSDAVMAGTPGWRLVDYYIGRGLPVVAISGAEQMGRFFLDDRVISLDRPADRDSVIAAVKYLAGKRGSVAEIGMLGLTPRSTPVPATVRGRQAIRANSKGTIRP